MFVSQTSRILTWRKEICAQLDSAFPDPFVENFGFTSWGGNDYGQVNCFFEIYFEILSVIASSGLQSMEIYIIMMQAN